METSWLTLGKYELFENQRVNSDSDAIVMDHFMLSGWRVEPRELRISGHGHVRDLEPRVMGVLVALARTPGMVVSKEALIADAWSGTPVSDNAITWAVSRLRKALSPESSLIRTVTGEGYRLEAAVTPIQSKRGNGWRPGWIAAAVALILIVAFAIHWSMRWEVIVESPPLEKPSYLRLTTMGGRESDPALSDDGRWLAFSHRPSADARWTLHTVPVAEDSLLSVMGNSGEATGERRRSLRPPVPQRIPQPPSNNRSPSWSPDGGQLAYVATNDQVCFVRLLTLTADRLGTSQDQKLFACPPNSRTRIEWTQNDHLLTSLLVDGQRRLHSFDLRTGELTVESSPEDAYPGDAVFAVGADRDHGVLVRQDAARTSRLLPFTVMDGRTSISVDPIAILPFHFYGLAVRSDESLVLNATDYQLVGIDPDTGDASALLEWPERVWHVASSRADDRLYFESLLPDRSSIIQVQPNADGILETVGEPIIRSARSDSGAVRSEDGALAWISDRSGSEQIWIREPGGPDRQLSDARGPRRFSSLAFSPDGSRILAIVDGQLGSMNRAGTDFTPHSSEGDDVIDASWAPDSASVLFARRSTDQYEWLLNGVAAQPGNARVLMPDVVSGKVRKDGARVWFDSSAMWMKMPEQDPRRVGAFGVPESWWLDGDSAWLVNQHSIRQVDLKSGTALRVLTLDALYLPHATAMDDGTFLVTRLQPRESDIVLLSR